MLASSGETTALCGVPTFVSDHRPSSETPAFNHFWIRRSIRRSATRCSMNFIVHSWFHVVKEATNVRIEHPVHSLPLNARRQRVQRLMRAATGPEPIRKAFEVDLIDLVEDRHHSLLNDFVLQCSDAQWALPPIGLRNIDSS